MVNYEVDKIVGRKKTRRNDLFLVKWMDGSTSYVPAHDLRCCEALIEYFDRMQPQPQRKKRKNDAEETDESEEEEAEQDFLTSPCGVVTNVRGPGLCATRVGGALQKRILLDGQEPPIEILCGRNPRDSQEQASSSTEIITSVPSEGNAQSPSPYQQHLAKNKKAFLLKSPKCYAPANTPTAIPASSSMALRKGRLSAFLNPLCFGGRSISEQHHLSSTPLWPNEQQGPPPVQIQYTMDTTTTMHCTSTSSAFHQLSQSQSDIVDRISDEADRLSSLASIPDNPNTFNPYSDVTEQFDEDQENEPADQPAHAPTFVQPVAEHTISEEEELVLEVKTTGKPHTVKWYNDGQELELQLQHGRKRKLARNKKLDRMRMEKLGPDHFRLVIPLALAADSGNYAVEVTNDSGKAKCEAQQTVERFPVFIRPMQDVEMAEGEKAEFWCETNLRSIPCTVKWFHNGQELKASDRLEMRVEQQNGIFRLVINSTLKEDVGTYRLSIDNTAGKIESSAQLGVRSAEVLIESVEGGGEDAAPNALAPAVSGMIDVGQPVEATSPTIVLGPPEDVELLERWPVEWSASRKGGFRCPAAGRFKFVKKEGNFYRCSECKKRGKTTTVRVVGNFFLSDPYLNHIC